MNTTSIGSTAIGNTGPIVLSGSDNPTPGSDNPTLILNQQYDSQAAGERFVEYIFWFCVVLGLVMGVSVYYFQTRNAPKKTKDGQVVHTKSLSRLAGGVLVAPRRSPVRSPNASVKLASQTVGLNSYGVAEITGHDAMIGRRSSVGGHHLRGSFGQHRQASLQLVGMSLGPSSGQGSPHGSQRSPHGSRHATGSGMKGIIGSGTGGLNGNGLGLGPSGICPRPYFNPVGPHDIKLIDQTDLSSPDSREKVHVECERLDENPEVMSFLSVLVADETTSETIGAANLENRSQSKNTPTDSNVPLHDVLKNRPNALLMPLKHDIEATPTLFAGNENRTNPFFDEKVHSMDEECIVGRVLDTDSYVEEYTSAREDG